MDKREIAAKITQKKEEIKNLISQDKLEDAKNARKAMTLSRFLMIGFSLFIL